MGNEYALKHVIQFEQGLTDPTESASGKQYPMLHLKMCVERRLGYWIFNIVLPLFFITTVSLISFAVPPEDVADRAGITLTVMLTLVAFKYSVADKLPQISYLTIIDAYVLLCFVLSVALMGEHFLAGLKHLEEPAASWLVCMAAFTWFGLHLLIVVVLHQVRVWQSDPFWSSRKNMLWLGTSDRGRQQKNGGSSDGDGGNGNSKRIQELQDYCHLSISAEDGSVARVSMWTAQQAKEKCQEISQLNNNLGRKRHVKEYIGEHNFFVVTFTTERAAIACLKRLQMDLAEKKLKQSSCSSAGLSGVVVGYVTGAEHLHPQWYCLASSIGLLSS